MKQPVRPRAPHLALQGVPKYWFARSPAASHVANAVNLLVETVVLNYMALHGQANDFATPAYFPGQGLGSPASRDALVAFAPICNGVITA